MSTFLDPILLSFYISFLGILSMLFLKINDIKNNKKNFFFRILEKTDIFFINTYHSIIKIISYINKKSAIALIQWIAYHILSYMRNVYIWAHRKAHAHPPSKRVIDMVRGRGEVRKNGGVSFFLKSISTEDEADVGK